MDLVVVLAAMLLVGLTWLFYKLTVLLQPRLDKPGANRSEHSCRKLIHERLRK